MGSCRVVRLTALTSVAAGLALGACTAPSKRPPAPVCGYYEVAEWEAGDGWECEPDADRNGIDDEDDDGGQKNRRSKRR